MMNASAVEKTSYYYWMIYQARVVEREEEPHLEYH